MQSAEKTPGQTPAIHGLRCAQPCRAWRDGKHSAIVGGLFSTVLGYVDRRSFVLAAARAPEEAAALRRWLRFRNPPRAKPPCAASALPQCPATAARPPPSSSPTSFWAYGPRGPTVPMPQADALLSGHRQLLADGPRSRRARMALRAARPHAVSQAGSGG